MNYARIKMIKILLFHIYIDITFNLRLNEKQRHII